MKHHFHVPVAYFLVGGIIAAGSLIVWYRTTHTAPPTTTHPLITTKPIDHNQSIGGAPTDTSSARKASPPATVGTPSAPAASAQSPVAAQPAALPRVSPQAPRQAEVAASVTTEYRYRALGIPNDPYYAPYTDSKGVAHTPYALQHIGAPTVWDKTTGSPTIIAVLDTGFALAHEDLVNQWHQNPGETGTTKLGDKCWTGVPTDKAKNNCDDDTNGYVDDWRGWNFYGTYTPSANPCTTQGTVTSNNNPMAGTTNIEAYYSEQKTCKNLDLGDPYEAISHGTSTAGIAGATSNNSLGISTLNWNAKLMPLQVLADDGSGWTSDIVAAIRYAVDNGANVINMSLGGSTNDPALTSAIDYAYSKNVIVVAAAGNCGTGKEYGCDATKPGAMGYPALDNHVISVGATDSNDLRASFSSYGRGLDVVAPGSGELISPLIDRPLVANVLSRDKAAFNYTTSYSANLYGTSFASPYVANLASLIKSVKPSYTVDDVTALIDGSARKLPQMNGQYFTGEYGHGIVNADAVATIGAALASTTTPKITLAQTGDYRSEHSFSANATMGSGCTVAASTYCTIRIQEPSTGFDRYLPYRQADTNGNTGWHWSGATLGDGLWSVRAMQGSTLSSSPYDLLSK